MITESKLDNNVTNASLACKNHKIYRQDRDSKGGGVICYIKNEIESNDLYNLNLKYKSIGLEVICIKLNLSTNGNIIIIGLYRPPNVKQDFFVKLRDLLTECSEIGKVILMGDINCDMMKPNYNVAKTLNNLLQSFDLKLNDGTCKPTRITSTSSTCLDIIAVDSSLIISEYNVLDLASSDHLPVNACLEIPVKFKKFQPIWRRDLKNTNLEILKKKVKNLSTNNNQDINIVTFKWYEDLNKIIEEEIPMRAMPYRRNRSTLVNFQIKKLIHKRNSLAKRAQNKALSDNEWDELTLLKRKIKSQLRAEAKKLGNSVIQQKKPAKTWKLIRELTHTTTESKEDNIIKIDDLNKYFASITNNPNAEEHSSIQGCDNNNSFSFSPISVFETQRTLQTMNSKTSPGYDNISATIIKLLSQEIAPSLTYLFNLSISQSSFPDRWKQANITAIWKRKGSKLDANNYRPISVLPILARTFEKLIAKQLGYHCHINKLLPSQQFGFRSNSSCEHALITMTDKWMEQVDLGMYVGALMIDFSKAFDTISHETLLLKLQKLNISQSANQLLESYLTNRKQRVIGKNTVTEWQPVTRGVPQGSCLSPLLFSIYVSDLPMKITADVYQFADDTTEANTASTIEELVPMLEKNLKETLDYCSENALQLNLQKTQLIIFKQPSKKLPEDFTISLDNVVIKPSTSTKILGFTLDSHFTFTAHIDEIITKAHSSIGLLRKAIRYLPRQLVKAIYVSLTRSLLEYCSCVFAGTCNTNKKKLETVQKIAARIICEVPRDSHAEPLLRALKLDSLDSRRAEHMLKITKDIISGKTETGINSLLKTTGDNLLVETNARTVIGRKRFSYMASRVYNSAKLNQI